MLQLDGLPPQWPQVEREALRRLVPGSTQWATVADLHSLASMGFPRDFIDLTKTQKAAQFRVVHWEAWASGGLAVQSRARALRALRLRSNEVVRSALWADWFDRSFLLQLDGTVQDLAALGITASAVEAQLVGDAPRPLLRAQAVHMRLRFQNQVLRMMPGPDAVMQEHRMRRKLHRWALPGFPRVQARRALAFLRTLRNRVPPRVWAAVLRALWNAWPTSRRLQGRGGLPRCIFDCAPDAQDSIEHYAFCRRLAALAEQALRLPQPAAGQRLADFLGVVEATVGDAGQIVRAVRLAALYRLHCQACHGKLAIGRQACEAFPQACREVVRGCARGERIYDAAAGGWL